MCSDSNEYSRSYDLLTIAAIEARLGRFDDARATIGLVDPDAVPKRVDDVRFKKAGTLLTLANAQLVAGAGTDAGQSVADALRIVRSIRRPEMISHPQGRAADIYLKLGQIEQAKALFAGRAGWPTGETWEWKERVAAAEREAGDEAAARADLRLALERAEAQLRNYISQPPEPEVGPGPRPLLGSADPIVQAAAEVARLRLKLGDREAALRTLDGLPDASRREALPDLAMTLAGQGELDAAWSLIDEIDAPELRDRAIFRVALALPASSVAGANPEAGTSR